MVRGENKLILQAYNELNQEIDLPFRACQGLWPHLLASLPNCRQYRHSSRPFDDCPNWPSLTGFSSEFSGFGDSDCAANTGVMANRVEKMFTASYSLALVTASANVCGGLRTNLSRKVGSLTPKQNLGRTSSSRSPVVLPGNAFMAKARNSRTKEAMSSSPRCFLSSNCSSKRPGVDG